jgi:hypothetical protein
MLSEVGFEITCSDKYVIDRVFISYGHESFGSDLATLVITHNGFDEIRGSVTLSKDVLLH